jgi:hypothetical protein
MEKSHKQSIYFLYFGYNKIIKYIFNFSIKEEVKCRRQMKKLM